MPLPVSFNQRLGFHYLPDTLHYRQEDLETWLPILTGMGATWVTLLAPTERAIPETFLSGLLAAGIQPVLHFTSLVPGAPPPLDDLRPLLSSYSRWGVREVVFFERPNLRSCWQTGAWVQGDLVERFLDGYLPLASLALSEGLRPVFPPLEPGGDYWDLAFLGTALRSLQRRAAPVLLDRLALGIYAFAGERPLNWGIGGPERWPGLRPYQAASGMQDQRGFRIFDWHLSVAQAELGKHLPVLLLRAGYCLPAGSQGELPGLADQLRHARQNLAIAQALSGQPAPQAGQIASDGLTAAYPAELSLPVEPIPEAVLACNFWLLSAAPGDPHAAQAWFTPTQEPQAVVGSFRQWAAFMKRQPPVETPLSTRPTNAPAAGKRVEDQPPVLLSRAVEPGGREGGRSQELSSGLLSDLHWALDEDPALPNLGLEPPAALCAAPQPASNTRQPGSPAALRRPISHYVLLPLYAWGAANWDLATIEPLLQDAHPTIGFSLAEARHAERVTVIGGEGAISGDALDMLRQSGCQVERILDDGTFVAT